MAQDLDHGMDADVPEGKEVPGEAMSSSQQAPIRQHSVIGKHSVKAVLETRRVRKKKMVQAHFRKADEKQSARERVSRDSGQKPHIREDSGHQQMDDVSGNKEFGKKSAQCKSGQEKAGDSLGSVCDGTQKGRKRRKLYEE